MSETKSDTIELRVNGETLAEFIVDRLNVQVTRYEVLIRGECRDTYADKVLLSSDALEYLGYAPDASDIPEPSADTGLGGKTRQKPTQAALRAIAGWFGYVHEDEAGQR